ncbi:TVP38/TMEM64 family protein [Hydrocarboniphaga sp.]|uniref:TVP38/TMEM64 family protein n=1 Tax=Hydrocarboniphaga sp. TaxID=2033016 RepID=UPI003D0EEEB9
MTPAPARRSKKISRVLALLLVAVGVGCALWLHREHAQWSGDSLRAFIEQWPLAPLAFIVVMVLRPFLLMPSALVMTAGGALFGVLGGTVLGSIGGALGGAMSFWLARSLGRDFVERRLGGRLAKVDRAFGQRRSARLVALYTAFPATPLGVAQVACGLSAMRGLPFAVATLIGLLPRTALLAWFGDSLAQQQWLRAATALLLILLVVAIGFALRRRAVAVAAEAGPASGPTL